MAKRGNSAILVPVIIAGIILSSVLFIGLDFTGFATYGTNGPENCSSFVNEISSLEGNITGCSGSGLIINASDIAINCNGFFITGTGNGAGIDIYNHSNVSIINCTLSGFKYGILANLSNVSLANNTQHNNSYGIYVESSNIFSLGYSYPNSLNNNTNFLYNNSNDLFVINTGALTNSFHTNDMWFLNPSGTLENYTRFWSETQLSSGKNFSISWSDNQSYAPPQYRTSFDNKYVQVTGNDASGFYLLFSESELSGYSLPAIELWYNNGTGWVFVSKTPFIDPADGYYYLGGIPYEGLYGVFENAQPVECGAHITSSNLMPGNLVCNGTGLFIDASNVNFDCNGNRITLAGNNSAGFNISGVNNVTLSNCLVSSHIENGTNISNIGFLVQDSSNVTLLNNNATLGYDAKALSDIIGFMIKDSDGINLSHVSVYGYPYLLQSFFEKGFYILSSNVTFFNVSTATTLYGIYDENSNIKLSDSLFFHNNVNNITGSDFFINNSGTSSMSLDLQKIRFSSGLYSKELFSLNDSVEAGTAYRISGNNTRVGPMIHTWIPFSHIVMWVSNVTGGVSLDSVSMYWDDSTLGYYNESSFAMMRMNGGSYSILNQTPDTVNNVISVSDDQFTNPAGRWAYELLSNQNCGEVSNDYTFTGDFQCNGTGLIVTAPNIVIDCAGYKLSGKSSLGGVILSGMDGIYANSAAKNVTIKNCIEANFTYGLVGYGANMTFFNNTIISNYNTGIISEGAGSNIINNTLIKNAEYGIFSSAYNKNITGNYISSSDRGIVQNYGYQNFFYNNSISNIRLHAMLLSGTYNSSVVNNYIKNSSNNAFYLSNNANNNVLNNNVAVKGTRLFYIITSNNNNITGNTAINASSFGVYLLGSSNNTFSNNLIYRETTKIGFAFAVYSTNASHSENNTFLNNTAYNSGRGFQISGSYNNNFSGNQVYNNLYGVYISHAFDTSVNMSIPSQKNTFSDNVLFGNTNGVYVLSDVRNNTFLNNTLYRNSYGFHFDSTNGSGNYYNNRIFNSTTTGVYIFNSSAKSFLSNNDVYNNPTGYYLLNSINSTIESNIVYNNSFGFRISNSSGNHLHNNSVFNNTQAGFKIVDSNSPIVDNSVFNNGMDLIVNSTKSSFLLNIVNMSFLNPSGTAENYSVLSIYDSVPSGNSYYINWSVNSSALPPTHESFANKFVDITTISGTVSIDSLVWSWLDSESASYNENRFEIWRYGGGWTGIGGTVDSSANTLTVLNVNPQSTFGILEGGDFNQSNITYPNNLEFFMNYNENGLNTGEIINVTWTASPGGYYYLDYSNDSGATWHNIVYTSNTYYGWNISKARGINEGTNYTLRVTASDGLSNSTSDVSDEQFWIGNCNVTDFLNVTNSIIVCKNREVDKDGATVKEIIFEVGTYSAFINVTFPNEYFTFGSNSFNYIINSNISNTVVFTGLTRVHLIDSTLGGYNGGGYTNFWHNSGSHNLTLENIVMGQRFSEVVESTSGFMVNISNSSIYYPEIRGTANTTNIINNSVLARATFTEIAKSRIFNSTISLSRFWYASDNYVENSTMNVNVEMNLPNQNVTISNMRYNSLLDGLLVNGTLGLKLNVSNTNINLIRIYSSAENSTNIIKDSNIVYLYLYGSSVNYLSDLFVHTYAGFYGNSVNYFNNYSDGGATNTYLYGNTKLNFTNSTIRKFEEVGTSSALSNAEVMGNLTIRNDQVTTWYSDTNVTRFFPTYVLNSSSDPESGASVSVLNSSGATVWSGVTDSNGYVEPNVTFNENNYGVGNFSVLVIGSFGTSPLYFAQDTPIIIITSELNESNITYPVSNSLDRFFTNYDESGWDSGEVINVTWQDAGPSAVYHLEWSNNSGSSWHALSTTSNLYYHWNISKSLGFNESANYSLRLKVNNGAVNVSNFTTSQFWIGNCNATVQGAQTWYASNNTFVCKNRQINLNEGSTVGIVYAGQGARFALVNVSMPKRDNGTKFFVENRQVSSTPIIYIINSTLNASANNFNFYSRIFIIDSYIYTPIIQAINNLIVRGVRTDQTFTEENMITGSTVINVSNSFLAGVGIQLYGQNITVIDSHPKSMSFYYSTFYVPNVTIINSSAQSMAFTIGSVSNNHNISVFNLARNSVIDDVVMVSTGSMEINFSNVTVPNSLSIVLNNENSSNTFENDDFLVINTQGSSINSFYNISALNLISRSRAVNIINVSNITNVELYDNVTFIFSNETMDHFVTVNRTSGFSSNSLINIYGNLSITNKAYNIKWEPGVEARRYFPVFVKNSSDDVEVGASVSVLNSSGATVWSGVTDSSGYVEPNVTFANHNYGVGNFSVLVVGSFGTSPVYFTQDTPIIIITEDVNGSNITYPVSNSLDKFFTNYDENGLSTGEIINVTWQDAGSSAVYHLEWSNNSGTSWHWLNTTDSLFYEWNISKSLGFNESANYSLRLKVSSGSVNVSNFTTSQFWIGNCNVTPSALWSIKYVVVCKNRIISHVGNQIALGVNSSVAFINTDIIASRLDMQNNRLLVYFINSTLSTSEYAKLMPNPNNRFYFINSTFDEFVISHTSNDGNMTVENATVNSAFDSVIYADLYEGATNLADTYINFSNSKVTLGLEIWTGNTGDTIVTKILNSEIGTLRLIDDDKTYLINANVTGYTQLYDNHKLNAKNSSFKNIVFTLRLNNQNVTVSNIFVNKTHSDGIYLNGTLGLLVNLTDNTYIQTGIAVDPSAIGHVLVQNSNITSLRPTGDSTLTAVNTSVLTAAQFKGDSVSDIIGCNISGTFDLSGFADVNFTNSTVKVFSSIYNESSSDNPVVRGILNVTQEQVSGPWSLNINVTRFFPIQVINRTGGEENGALIEVFNSSNGLVWSGSTDANGWVDANVTFTNKTYGKGNFTIVATGSIGYGETYLTDDTPIIIQTGCTDDDGDGFNVSEAGCGVIFDCDDTNASILPPYDNMSIFNSTKFCPGTYYFWPNINNLSIEIVQSNLTLDCNGANIFGRITGGLITSDIAIYGTNKGNVKIKNCNLFNFTRQVVFVNYNNLSINNFNLINSRDYSLSFVNVKNVNVDNISISQCRSNGIYFVSSSNVSITSSTFFNNYNAIVIYADYNTTFSDIQITNSSLAGLTVNDATNTLVKNMHLYNNNLSIQVESLISPASVWLYNVSIDNPLGNYVNYTNFNLNDNILLGESYQIKWARSPVSLPSGARSFEGKFLNISPVPGKTSSISSISFNWLDSESSAYNESDLQLWKFNGTWSLLNDSPDTVNNKLSLSNLNPKSTYAILNGTASCVVPYNDMYINEDTILCNGTYYINDSGALGIIIINNSNIVLDCNHAFIYGNYSGKGIFSQSRSNNTIKNCNISKYQSGIHLNQSSNNTLLNNIVYTYKSSGFYLSSNSNNNTLINNRAYNDTDNSGYGFYLDGVKYNFLKNNVAHYNFINFFLSSSEYNTLINNTASPIISKAFSRIGFELRGSNNILINNTAHDNNFYGFYLYTNSKNNTLIGNTAYNNGLAAFYISPGTFVGNFNNNITNNTAYNNSNEGFLMNFVNNNTLKWNKAYGNLKEGIKLTKSNNNVLEYNEFYNNSIGIRVDDNSKNIRILNNTIFNNLGEGIFVRLNSNALIYNNSITNNSFNGVNITTNSSANITDNFICYNGLWGIYSLDSILRPLDLSSANTLCDFNTLGKISMNWYLQVRVINNTANVSGATVRIYELNNLTPQYTALTNIYGLTNTFIVRDYTINNSDVRTNYSNHTIQANKSTDEKIEETFMNESKIVVLNITAVCTDADADGFNVSQAGCGVVFDCNDNDANVVPPALNLNVNRNLTLCSGVYSINVSQQNKSIISFTSSNKVLTCNNTVIIGNGSGVIFSITGSGNELRNCQASNYFMGAEIGRTILASDTLILNNTFNNSYYGVYIGYDSYANNITLNAVYDSVFGIFMFKSQNNSITSNKLIGSSNRAISNFINTGADSNNTIIKDNILEGAIFDLSICGSNNTVFQNHMLSGGVQLSCSNLNNKFCVGGEGNFYEENIPWSVIGNGTAGSDCGPSNLTSPLNGSSVSGNINLEWTNQSVIDDYNVSFDLFYNGTGGSWNYVGNTKDLNYSFDTSSMLDGEYIFRLVPWINGSRINATNDYVTFNVINFVNQPPAIILNLPANDSQLVNINNTALNFTVTDDFNTTLACDLYINGILNQTNSSVQNNTLTNFYIDINPGNYNWSVNCTDGELSAVSETRTFDVTILNLLITLTGCTPTTKYTGNTVTCSADITSYYDLDNISARVTSPNSNIYNQNVICSGSSTSKSCSFAFSQTNSVGNYNYLWSANNSAGNSTSASSLFTITSPYNPPSDNDGGGTSVNLPPTIGSFDREPEPMPEPEVINVTEEKKPEPVEEKPQPVEPEPQPEPRKFPWIWIIIALAIAFTFFLILFLWRRKEKKNELVVYIKKSRKKGFTDKQIKQKLLEKQWPEKLIDEAFLMVDFK